MAKRYRGRDLRQERLKAGLSQEQLAVLLGAHQGTISLIELEKEVEAMPDFAQKWLVACQEAVAA